MRVALVPGRPPLYTLAMSGLETVNDADQATTIGIIDRLSRLEGLLLGLQNNIGQSQLQWTASQRRVELLEQRMGQLELGRVTKEDMKELTNKVDALIGRSKETSGVASVLNWAVKNVAPWLAILLSIVAIRDVATREQGPPPAAPTAQAPHDQKSLP